MKTKISNDTAGLVEILQALGHPTRVELLKTLEGEGGCGGLYTKTLAKLLGIRPSVCSHHLQLLKRAGILKHQQQGGYRVWEIVAARLVPLTEWLEGLEELL